VFVTDFSSRASVYSLRTEGKIRGTDSQYRVPNIDTQN